MTLPEGYGRRAAGEDPAKREQILDGARRVFLRDGFDGASMNEITREAGVSKGTIYVYFDSKEDLFAALIDRQRSRVVETVRNALHNHDAIEDALYSFGTKLTMHLVSEQTIRSMRTVLGVIDRMPKLADRFFSTTAANGVSVLTEYLDKQVAEGRLAIDDTDLAARQFIEMSMAGLFKRCLFGNLPEPKSVEEIAPIVKSAVRVFLAGYRPEL
ncbi:TetR/AcrR family transcriptional regulator [Rhizobiaceae bacterium n13]|uniref:TetR/AcrR family transcriptional regulator n=2 Tax=Ferirhizobium litorale TaxID=2927786 RepID=A0AAE3QB43_9HYPH|nr:TetR/AcrR family transcriptional regulator [Fererhizobium litorale]MDI7860430.1 TetR/AcrR family transcriptional regulator [Fererhizobium litorale]MDI7920565.1 TetR/AcrR family transcriptional regulator [Fererhizobium litorale]